MFHKYEWVFQVILFIGILYTAYGGMKCQK